MKFKLALLMAIMVCSASVFGMDVCAKMSDEAKMRDFLAGISEGDVDSLQNFSQGLDQSNLGKLNKKRNKHKKLKRKIDINHKGPLGSIRNKSASALGRKFTNLREDNEWNNYVSTFPKEPSENENAMTSLMGMFVGTKLKDNNN